MNIMNNDNYQTAARFFVFVAYAFWPSYISLSLALVERTRLRLKHETTTTSPDRRNQNILAYNTLLGAVLSDIVVDRLKQHEYFRVTVVGSGHLRYSPGWGLHEYTVFGMLVYIYCVVGSLFQSSLKYTNLFAWAVLWSLFPTLLLWIKEFPSMWCFFAAGFSSIVVLVVWSELQRYRT